MRNAEAIVRPVLRCAIAVCLALVVHLAIAGQPADKAALSGAQHQLRIHAKADAPWGGAIPNVEAVLNSAANELWQHFPERTLSPILVEPKGGPIVLFARGPNGEYQVRLDTGDQLWSQHAYQFAHEFCHILCDYNSGREHNNKWFEESLCELASIFAIRRMAETWKTKPPYPNWKGYSPALAKYADDLVRKGQVPGGMTLDAWFRENADALYSNAGLREKNNVVAVALLPLFEQQPKHWEAVTCLYATKPKSRQSLADFLAAWRAACPERHRELVGRIVGLFGSAAAKLPPEKPVPVVDESNKLRITAAADGPWGGQVADVEAVLNSAAGELWKFFPGRKLARIIVEPKGGPLLLAKRGPSGEFYVRLDTGERLWAQHAYQFSYLFGRITCGADAGDSRHKWFEDSLCQLAAVFALRRMAETWKTNPPYSNWRDYSRSLADYAAGVLKPGQLPDGVTLAAWYRENAEQVAARRDLEQKTKVVAAALLPVFEREPEHWSAVTYINVPEARQAPTFTEFLKAWRNACPEQHRALVSKIAAEFGIEAQ